MTGQVSVYDYLKASYSNAYVVKIDQTVDLHSPLPILLIEFPVTVPSSNKDQAVRDFATLLVHVINKDYSTALIAAKNVRTLLDGWSGTGVYLCEFEKEESIREDDAKVYRFIVEFQVKL